MHRLGAVLLWGAVPIAATGAWLAREGMPGIVLFAAAAALVAAGAALKRRHCPCRTPAPD